MALVASIGEFPCESRVLVLGQQVDESNSLGSRMERLLDGKCDIDPFGFENCFDQAMRMETERLESIVNVSCQDRLVGFDSRLGRPERVKRRAVVYRHVGILGSAIGCKPHVRGSLDCSERRRRTARSRFENVCTSRMQDARRQHALAYDYRDG